MKIVVEFDTLEEFESFRGKGEDIEKTEDKKGNKEKKSPAKEAVNTKGPETKEEVVEEKIYTKEDVRAVLMKVKRAKGDGTLSELLGTFGASKLTEVDDSDYPELIRKAEEVLNA